MKFVKTLAFVIALAAITLAPRETAAGAPEDMFNRGNAAYRNGEYKSAIELYREAGLENTPLLYNRGNAHFRSGEIGMAILHYRRALKIEPRNEDIRHNLEYARLIREDKIKEERESYISRGILAPYRYVSLNEHASATLALLTVLTGLLIARTLSRDGSNRPRLKGAIIAFSILLGGETLLAGIKTFDEIRHRHCVITKKAITAYSAPALSSEKVFELHDGAEARMERRENGFVLIMLPTGWTGWVSEDAVGII